MQDDSISRLKKTVEAKIFDHTIIALIVINAMTLGLETTPGLAPQTLEALRIADRFFLAVFTVELLLKMLVYRRHFFRDPWRIFDLVVVGVALLPSAGPLAVVRALRVLRALRLVSVVPALRRVVNGLLSAIPGLSAVGAIMALVFYVGAVVATKLFGDQFPEWFGTIWASAYTLFQVMTLESWSMGIVRPVMEKFPFAWMFFLPFIGIATFTMLNLFIAVIVNAMQSETEKAAADRASQGHDERLQLLTEVKELKELVRAMATAPERDSSRTG